METKFKNEIEKATNAAIVDVQNMVRARHNELLNVEKKRLQEALAKAVV